MAASRAWSARPLANSSLLRNGSLRQPSPLHPRSFFTSSRPPTTSRLSRGALATTTSPTSAPFRSPLLRQFRSLRFKSSKSTRPSQNPDPTPHLGSPEPAPSLSQRLRKLSREYGWSAVGVYFALSALDFPFCFLAVRWLGTDTIGRWEHAVIDAFWTVVRIPFPNLGKKPDTVGIGAADEDVAQATVREGNMGWVGEVSSAEANNKSAEASIWTQLALAYAIHKSFIFIRVPVTAAILPKVVKTLRGWGWNIGKRTPKSK